jgi:sugar O-acyltransferase (sialic acid O-acetyltransferase NeuD family)
VNLVSTPVPVLIVGAGGFGGETASLLAALEEEGTYTAAGFADDSAELQGRSLAGVPILGPIEIARDLVTLGVVVTVGNPRRFDAKEAIVEHLDLDDDRYVTLIHPTASIGTQVSIGRGTVILAGCVVTQGVTIGRHVALMPNVVLTHDDDVGDFAILGAGVRLGGGVKVGRGAYIGSGASIRESTAIGPGAMIGMGAVVVDDVPQGEIWAGVPARQLRTARNASATGG